MIPASGKMPLHFIAKTHEKFKIMHTKNHSLIRIHFAYIKYSVYQRNEAEKFISLSQYLVESWTDK